MTRKKLTKEEHHFAFLAQVIHSRNKTFNLSVFADVLDEKGLGSPSLARLKKEAKKYGFEVVQGSDEDEYKLRRILLAVITLKSQTLGDLEQGILTIKRSDGEEIERSWQYPADTSDIETDIKLSHEALEHLVWVAEELWGKGKIKLTWAELVEECVKRHASPCVLHSDEIDAELVKEMEEA